MLSIYPSIHLSVYSVVIAEKPYIHGGNNYYHCISFAPTFFPSSSSSSSASSGFLVQLVVAAAAFIVVMIHPSNHLKACLIITFKGLSIIMLLFGSISGGIGGTLL